MGVSLLRSLPQCLLVTDTGEGLEPPKLKSGDVKPRSKLRLVLKPLPVDEEVSHTAQPAGSCCEDSCVDGSAESEREECSSEEGALSSSRDGSSCQDSPEDQLPLPSSQGDRCMLTFYCIESR